MSFTELAVESSLQLILQFFVVILFIFTGIRPTFLQVFTIATSALTVSFGAGKAVVISTQLPDDNPKKRVFRRLRNVIWNVTFLATSMVVNLIPPLLAIVVGLTSFKSFTTLYKVIFVALWSIQLFYFVFMCIFMLKNHLGKSQQPWLKCIMLSAYYFYACISYGISFLVLVPQISHSIIVIVTVIVGFMFLSLFYLYASFIVLKFRDVLNLEVLESRHKCPVPNLLFIISLFSIGLFVFGLGFSGMLYSD